MTSYPVLCRGTLGYSPPESASRAVPTDGGTYDTYAFFAMAYTMLTAVCPHTTLLNQFEALDREAKYRVHLAAVEETGITSGLDKSTKATIAWYRGFTGGFPEQVQAPAFLCLLCARTTD